MVLPTANDTRFLLGRGWVGDFSAEVSLLCPFPSADEPDDDVRLANCSCIGLFCFACSTESESARCMSESIDGATACACPGVSTTGGAESARLLPPLPFSSAGRYVGVNTPMNSFSLSLLPLRSVKPARDDRTSNVGVAPLSPTIAIECGWPIFSLRSPADSNASTTFCCCSSCCSRFSRARGGDASVSGVDFASLDAWPRRWMMSFSKLRYSRSLAAIYL